MKNDNVMAALAAAGGEIERHAPELMAACEPRRIVPPHGYASSRHYATMIAVNMMTAKYGDINNVEKQGQNMMATKAKLCSNYMLLKHKVPTYYCRENLLTAISETNLPESFKCNDLKWPMPSMLFVLPIAWTRRYFGYAVPFMSVGHVDGELTCPIEKELGQKMPVSGCAGHKILMHQVVMLNSAPIDYTFVYGMDMEVSECSKPREFSDYLPFADGHNVCDEVLPSLAQEKVMVASMNTLTLQILLALTARPELVESGECIRKHKVKHGKEKSALWSPNMIGRRYSTKSEYYTEYHQSGEHNRPHWRRGHFRKQHHGKQNALTKIIWLEPVLVNAELLEA